MPPQYWHLVATEVCTVGGRYASYWNAFLFINTNVHFVILQVLRDSASLSRNEITQQKQNPQDLSRHLDSSNVCGITLSLLQELPLQHLEHYGQYIQTDMHRQIR